MRSHGDSLEGGGRLRFSKIFFMHAHKSSISMLLCMLLRISSERLGIGTGPDDEDCADSEDGTLLLCMLLIVSSEGLGIGTGLDDEDCADSEDGTCCCCCCCASGAEDCQDIDDCTDSEDGTCCGQRAS